MKIMLIFLIYICSIFVVEVYGNKQMLVAIGPGRNTNDSRPYDLEILEFVFRQSKLSTKNNLTSITDNCKTDFQWEETSKEKIEKEAKKANRLSVLHIGPLCDYYDHQAAMIEMIGYINDVKKIHSTLHLFVTPSLAIHITAEDLSRKSYYSNRGPEITPSKNSPFFISLNSNVDHFSKAIFKFADKSLSPHTVFLCVSKQYLNYIDKFCLRLTDLITRLSGQHLQSFVRFRYFGEKNEDGWKNIWGSVSLVTRYVVYCGDESLFLDWLEVGKKLWSPMKIEDFAIFFITFNIESNEYYEKSNVEDFLGKFFRNVTESSIQNIKIINFRSLFKCTGNFCNKLIDFAQGSDSKTDDISKRFYVNKVLFHSLGTYHLFSTLAENDDGLQVTDLDIFEQKYEIEIMDLAKQNGKVKFTTTCVLKTDDKVCHLNYYDKVPTKVPGKCGFDDCDRQTPFQWKLILYIVVGIVGSALIIAFISVFCYLRYRRKHEWTVAPLGDVRIKLEEIKPTEVQHEDIALKFSTGKKTKTTESFTQVIRLDPILMDPVLGLYRSTPVTVHPFTVAKNRAQSVDAAVKQLRSLNLENVAQIHGYVVQNTPYVHGLVIEFGEHGILMTLLKLDELDLALKLPLLADLCKGLEHIHKSSLKYHGNLTSMCCVVDAHFVLKIQLTDFPTLHKLAPNTEMTLDKLDLETDRLVWSAPEVLRKQPDIKLPLADIYSFGIIAHEIVYQKGPFFVSTKDLSAVHNPGTDGPLPKNLIDIAYLVVKILRNKNRRQIRPSLVGHKGEEAVMLILRDLIKSCWEDTPSQRPSLSAINRTIRKVMHDMGIVNVFGSMVERLEFYSKHLQDAVQMKADKVEEERRRVRRVLEQLFPGIAKALINGEKPKPVEYNNICVYFNDLVGFTKICSVNTPATVVKFLNTLFLKYDDIIDMYNIHPVTRIGDAYMLVSGVPVELKDKYHASEIAQAALQIVEAVRSMVFNYVEQYKSMQIRTGIASGRAATGVVGTEIPSYGICGGAVIVASKMESNSEAMKILVADSTYVLLKDEFDFEPGTKEVKLTNGSVIAHWLKGMKKVSKIELDKRLDGKARPDRKLDEGSSTYL